MTTNRAGMVKKVKRVEIATPPMVAAARGIMNSVPEPPSTWGKIPAMIARFGTINSPTWQNVENTALRLVCWMEEFRDR